MREKLLARVWFRWNHCRALTTNRDNFIGKLRQEGRCIRVGRKYDFCRLNRTTVRLNGPVSVTRRKGGQHGSVCLKVQGKLVDAETEEGSDKFVRPERACRIRRCRMGVDASSPAFRLLRVGYPFDYTIDLTSVCSEFLERCMKIIRALLVQCNVWRPGRFERREPGVTPNIPRTECMSPPEVAVNLFFLNNLS